ncbi:hypothetical protein O4H29_07070 [Marinobacter salarius]|uniref:hypothetical protein n=1 Tax=Marinobacter salarius TaxID=1420917 RepID=UPI0022B18C98|nr:hypothetical protein [Marinobacter salarius]MCZ4284595.1 hypothetical protein [Marinobacter salarius]
MSDREAFIDWWESRHYDNEDREVKKASWCAWKAAREQEGGEAVERMSIGRASRAGIRFEDREIYCRGWNDCLESHPPQSQGVPEGYVLAPKSMCITQEDVGLIVMMTGWDDEDQDDAEGVLWFGLIEDDEGNRTHGLNISCSECMEEGAIQLVQFDEPNSTPAAPQADEWVKCSERLPTEADADPWGCAALLIPEYEHFCESTPPLRVDVSRIPEIFERYPSALWTSTGLTRPQPPEQGDGV